MAAQETLVNITLNATDTDDDVRQTEYPFGRYLYVYFIIMFVVGAIGVVANIFALVVIVRTRSLRKHQSSVLITNQTVCDLIACMTLIVTFAVAMEKDSQLTGSLGELLCRVFVAETLFLVCFFASTFNLVSITIERYFMVVHPIKHRIHFTKRTSYIMVALSWLAGLCFLIPTAVTTTVRHYECRSRYLWPASRAKEFYFYAIIIGSFIIPFAILLYGYGRILAVLYDQKSVPLRNSSSSHTEKKRRKSVIDRAQLNFTKTMIVVSVAFVISVAPHQIYFACYQLLFLTLHYSYCYALLSLSLVNCVINPFIYGLTFKAFKKGAWSLIRCQKAADGEKSITPMVTISSE